VGRKHIARSFLERIVWNSAVSRPQDKSSIGYKFESFCSRRNISDLILSGEEKDEIVKNIEIFCEAEDEPEPEEEISYNSEKGGRLCELERQYIRIAQRYCEERIVPKHGPKPKRINITLYKNIK
jgi:hypothetical protein